MLAAVNVGKEYAKQILLFTPRVENERIICPSYLAEVDEEGMAPIIISNPSVRKIRIRPDDVLFEISTEPTVTKETDANAESLDDVSVGACTEKVAVAIEPIQQGMGEPPTSEATNMMSEIEYEKGATYRRIRPVTPRGETAGGHPGNAQTSPDVYLRR